ncbi:MAG: hypothetical protein KME38_13640 [Spirirestis rafaelensis WJT71-NPBG6]|nr:hypothetical protein [Spirirestis rafaelensis WJT71-NPBG6]
MTANVRITLQALPRSEKRQAGDFRFGKPLGLCMRDRVPEPSQKASFWLLLA